MAPSGDQTNTDTKPTALQWDIDHMGRTVQADDAVTAWASHWGVNPDDVKPGATLDIAAVGASARVTITSIDPFKRSTLHDGDVFWTAISFATVDGVTPVHLKPGTNRMVVRPMPLKSPPKKRKPATGFFKWGSNADGDLVAGI